MADQYIDGVVKRPVSELRPGDRVDLESDPIADESSWAGGGDGDSKHPEFAYEFEVVESVVYEPHDIDPAYCVTFESGFVCGFPADHLVEVDGEQERT